MSRKQLFKLSALLFTFTLLCSGKSQPLDDYSIQKQAAIVGHLEIPRLHISVPVLEGSGPNILAVAAGHIEGTSLPGPSGNMGIAAHRDTFFGPLREIRPDDIITLRTVNGSFSYAVNRTEVVAPSNVDVLHQTVDPQLTLVTCYPFRYKGPSPKRFIVHATGITDVDPSALGTFSQVGQ